MKESLKAIRDNFILLNEQLDELLERYRVKYYHEFILSVFSFGIVGIYMLYIYVRIPLLSVHSNTTLAYNLKQTILNLDLAGAFFAFAPYFDFISSVTLFGGCLWGVIKIFHHSLAKISEVELIPLPERIKKIEKEGEEPEDEE